MIERGGSGREPACEDSPRGGRLQAFTCDHRVVCLPPGHPFPMQKYALLREAVMGAGFTPPVCVVAPEPATDEQIMRVHDGDYLEKVKTGRLTKNEVRQMACIWRRGKPTCDTLCGWGRAGCGVCRPGHMPGGGRPVRGRPAGAVDTDLWDKVPFSLPRGALEPDELAERILAAHEEGHDGVLDL